MSKVVMTDGQGGKIGTSGEVARLELLIVNAPKMLEALRAMVIEFGKDGECDACASEIAEALRPGRLCENCLAAGIMSDRTALGQARAVLKEIGIKEDVRFDLIAV
jgi:hypothetical protein